jgi:hypothetical protein
MEYILIYILIMGYIKGSRIEKATQKTELRTVFLAAFVISAENLSGRVI